MSEHVKHRVHLRRSAVEERVVYAGLSVDRAESTSNFCEALFRSAARLKSSVWRAWSSSLSVRKYSLAIRSERTLQVLQHLLVGQLDGVRIVVVGREASANSPTEWVVEDRGAEVAPQGGRAGVVEPSVGSGGQREAEVEVLRVAGLGYL